MFRSELAFIKRKPIKLSVPTLADDQLTYAKLCGFLHCKIGTSLEKISRLLIETRAFLRYGKNVLSVDKEMKGVRELEVFISSYEETLHRLMKNYKEKEERLHLKSEHGAATKVDYVSVNKLGEQEAEKSLSLVLQRIQRDRGWYVDLCTALLDKKVSLRTVEDKQVGVEQKVEDEQVDGEQKKENHDSILPSIESLDTAFQVFNRYSGIVIEGDLEGDEVKVYEASQTSLKLIAQRMQYFNQIKQIPTFVSLKPIQSTLASNSEQIEDPNQEQLRNHKQFLAAEEIWRKKFPKVVDILNVSRRMIVQGSNWGELRNLVPHEAIHNQRDDNYETSSINYYFFNPHSVNMEFDTGHALFEERVKTIAKTHLGNCWEFATMALLFCMKNNIRGEIYEMGILDPHNFVVIGRKKESNRSDPFTWGASAIICDPWDNRCYPASEMAENFKRLFHFPDHIDYKGRVTPIEDNTNNVDHIQPLRTIENLKRNFLKRFNAMMHQLDNYLTFLDNNFNHLTPEKNKSFKTRFNRLGVI